MISQKPLACNLCNNYAPYCECYDKNLNLIQMPNAAKKNAEIHVNNNPIGVEGEEMKRVSDKERISILEDAVFEIGAILASMPEVGSWRIAALARTLTHPHFPKANRTEIKRFGKPVVSLLREKRK